MLINPDPGNNGNFDTGARVYTIDAPYWRTKVGEFENSESPYGTFDQAGNVWEWTESINNMTERIAPGDSYWDYAVWARANVRIGFDATLEANTIGFRVVLVPEPASLSLLVMGALSLLVLGGLGIIGRRR